LQVILIPWNDHPQRLDLVNGRVGAVQDARSQVRADAACNGFLQFGEEVRGKGHAGIVMQKLQRLETLESNEEY
jgi:hypothetical protein